MSRRRSRIIAFQALYSWDVTRASLEDIMTFSWLQKDSEFAQNENSVKELSDTANDELVFARFLIAGTIEHSNEIDKLIEEHLAANWSLERLNKVALAILRISIYEMRWQPDSKTKIIIDEAINIAKDFGAEDSYKFINAILDKIGKNDGEKE